MEMTACHRLFSPSRQKAPSVIGSLPERTRDNRTRAQVRAPAGPFWKEERGLQELPVVQAGSQWVQEHSGEPRLPPPKRRGASGVIENLLHLVEGSPTFLFVSPGLLLMAKPSQVEIPGGSFFSQPLNPVDGSYKRVTLKLQRQSLLRKQLLEQLFLSDQFRKGLTLWPRLVHSGTIITHCSFKLLGSSDSVTSVSQVARTTGASHHGRLIFLKLVTNSYPQAILRPQPPKVLELQVRATTSHLAETVFLFVQTITASGASESEVQRLQPMDHPIRRSFG
ncbi:Zinc finger protein [Plecturocebus cupreus]